MHQNKDKDLVLYISLYFEKKTFQSEKKKIMLLNNMCCLINCGEGTVIMFWIFFPLMNICGTSLNSGNMFNNCIWQPGIDPFPADEEYLK